MDARTAIVLFIPISLDFDLLIFQKNYSVMEAQAIASFPQWDSFMTDLSNLIDSPETDGEQEDVCDLTNGKLKRTKKMVETLRAGKGGLDSIIADRKYHLRTYRKCFGE